MYLAEPQRPWVAPQTTWTNYQTPYYWQATGVKGVDDRNTHEHVRKVKYTEVGSWLDFDVTELVQQGIYEYILYGSYAGTNKDIQFRSNNYWLASERPKLAIWYE
ncbi:MAG: DNRLRE domain-containing protein [Caldilineales bacterium]|nr:DNRLRE domain-containing protein [Caldilineales bacterium]